MTAAINRILEMNMAISLRAAETINDYLLKPRGYNLSTVRKAMVVAIGAFALTCLNGATVAILGVLSISSCKKEYFFIAAKYLGIVNCLVYAGVFASYLLVRCYTQLTAT